MNSKEEIIDIPIDEKGNPILPKGWTYLIHGSSTEKWNQEQLGKDFTVGVRNDSEVGARGGVGKALCCVESKQAKWDWRQGSYTARTYGRKSEKAFQIRILFYENPIVSEDARDVLNEEEKRNVRKYYLFQEGRHPAVPKGTRLTFIKNGTYDDIVDEPNNHILWYIPEQYIKNYLRDISQTIQPKKESEKPLGELKEKNDTHKDYEAKMSDRQNFSVSALAEIADNQDISKPHKDGMTRYITGLERKIDDLIYQAPTNVNRAEYAKYMLGRIYEKGFMQREKREMAKQFAKLEIEGVRNSDGNIRENDGNNDKNPKYLLNFEKTDGLIIDEEKAIELGITTSELNSFKKNMYVATYEKEDIDLKTGKTIVMPVKEYYKLEEDGDFHIVGKTNDEGKTELDIGNVEYEFDNNSIQQGKTITSVSQKELGFNFMKGQIEEQIGNGQEVTRISKITDEKFLNNFARQTGKQNGIFPNQEAYIISTLNEKGKEDFDIILYDSQTNKYQNFGGIQARETKGRDIVTTDGSKIVLNNGYLDRAIHKETKKEYITKDGHRYAITMNQNGKLGLDEILKEKNENIVARHVDTYSAGSLLETYSKMKIGLGDIRKSYAILKEAREKNSQERSEK